jgi:hypothetical protein
MKHKISHALYSYWNEIRGQRVAPRRFEIEPGRIAAILPDTFILDCGEPGTYRFRLAGTRMSSVLGRDVRDRSFLDLFASGDHATVAHVLRQTIDQAPVSVLTLEPAALGDPVARTGSQIEILLLPMFHTQSTVTRLLGSAARLDANPFDRMAAPALQSLVHHETIWPDGRPHAILAQMNRQSPFAPEHRLGRIVTSDRRRFRVFDGGKSP